MNRFQSHQLILRIAKTLTEEELRAVFGTALNIMSDTALAELASVTQRYTERRGHSFQDQQDERAAEQA